MNHRFLLNILIPSICLVQCNQKSTEEIENVVLIPQPLVIEQSDGNFIINSKTKIALLPNLNPKGKQLTNLLKSATGFDLEIIKPSDSNNIISLLLDDNLKNLEEEGYELA